jgi:hypothetical protein
MRYLPGGSAAFAVLFCAARVFSVPAQDPELLTEDQKRDFLLHANVVKAVKVNKGLTGIYRFTLSDGALTHDAAFQSIDESWSRMQNDIGGTEVNFRDSYKFNIAAFELAKLLGLDDMMPVTVERRWRGRIGSLSWWLPFKLDEEQRQKKKINPPDLLAWAKQMNKMYAFSQLVYDTDRNRGNILYSENWHVWMIDFTRAFRPYNEPADTKLLEQCDRRLWEKLHQLDAVEVEQQTKPWLNKMELKGLWARRDKLVAHFEKLIAAKGKKAVIIN